MTRSRRALLLLLAVQAALSGAAILMEGSRACAACLAGGFSPSVAGVAGYSSLLIMAWWKGPSGLVLSGIHFAFGVHCALAVQQFLSGNVCGLCVAAALGSLALVALSISVDRVHLGRMALVVPAAAFLAIFGLGIGTPRAPALDGAAGAIRIFVFTEPDCPYCDELRKQVMPEIEKEFGARIRVAWHSAAELSAIRRTPTLILSSGRSGERDRVIEGLPTLDRLRGAIRDLETGS